MKPITKALASLALASALGLIAYPIFAHCGKCAASAKTVATQLDASQMTLAKAVTAAEDHSKGRAVSVISSVGDNDQVAVHVFCLADGKLQKCHVDHKTGRVLDMKEVKEFPTADHTHDDKSAHDGAGGAATDDGTALMINSRTTDVGCGSCVYKMAGVEGCPLAVMLDGKPYIVQGATWPNHDYCDARQQAIVTGKIEDGKFVAVSVKPKA